MSDQERTEKVAMNSGPLPFDDELASLWHILRSNLPSSAEFCVPVIVEAIYNSQWIEDVRKAAVREADELVDHIRRVFEDLDARRRSVGTTP